MLLWEVHVLLDSSCIRLFLNNSHKYSIHIYFLFVSIFAVFPVTTPGVPHGKEKR